MRTFLLFGVIVLASFTAFPQAIRSNVYAYDQFPVVRHTGNEERTLFEGTTRDYSHLIVQVVTLFANQPNQSTQQLDEEAILVIKTGELTLTIGGKRKTLKPGNVIMIMPGDDYRIENKATQPLTYYQMRYTSNEMPDLDLYRLVGESFWVDWQEIAPTAADYGRDRRMVTCATVMSSRIALQLTTLAPSLENHAPHTHRAAEILIILDHPVQVTIDGVLKRAEVGDLIFIESKVPHSAQNNGQEHSTCLSLQF